jgi:hypothetical protein
MRLYRALLRLYPGSLRAAHGAEMCELHRQRRREAVGPLAVAAFWLQTIGDLLASAVLAHLDQLGQDLRFSVRTLRRSPGFAALERSARLVHPAPADRREDPGRAG